MDGKTPTIVRVFSNNAVLATLDGTEQVIVGRGVGFGRTAGDQIEDGSHRHYVEARADRLGFLQTLKDIPVQTLDVLAKALDLATDMLGDLHPSVYIVLTDHLVFAIQRLEEGQVIHNTLKNEIEAVFPSEYVAAETVLNYINTNLGIELPEDEAAFIALHLNAARTGVTVKQPLERANALAEVVGKIGADFGIPNAPAGGLLRVLADTRQRMQEANYRKNDATGAIYRSLPREVTVATQVIRNMLGTLEIPHEVKGEVAYLAVFLHGWRQDH
ncbi:MAG: PRD domain-containing protein [Actinomycetaceae bacterium]|nr:PRD domain-containing protein [Actinomycetaceae bacterium]